MLVGRPGGGAGGFGSCCCCVKAGSSRGVAEELEFATVDGAVVVGGVTAVSGGNPVRHCS